MTSDPERDRWNRRYASGDRVHTTAEPNRFLVAEVNDLAPGTALDVACGAGRNAVWLAERGWRVTAVDFSSVALGMARRLAAACLGRIEWIEADVVTWTPPALAYDLVCVLYLQLPADLRRQALAHAAGAVRPGGTLLVLGHDALNLAHGWGGPSKPDVLVTPEDIASEIVGAGLRVDKAERVRRHIEDDGVIHEAIDALVRARRP